MPNPKTELVVSLLPFCMSFCIFGGILVQFWLHDPRVFAAHAVTIIISFIAVELTSKRRTNGRCHGRNNFSCSESETTE